MKKTLLWAALCLIGVQSSSIAQEQEAQETSTEDKGEGHLYIGLGAVFTSDYNINEKLVAAGVPELGNSAPELTIGVNYTEEKVLIDVEWNTIYNGERRSNGLKVRNIGVGSKLRVQYIPFNNGNTFFAAGGDVSFIYNQFDLYRESNRIDLDNIHGNMDPNLQNFHISLYNQQLFAGPSIAAGFFQKKRYPIRLNMGYEWGLTNGKWKSEFAEVDNTVKENGFGRFYAKLSVYFL